MHTELLMTSCVSPARLPLQVPTRHAIVSPISSTMSDHDASKTTHRVAVRGQAILTSPRWNKGTAFTLEERTAFGLTGRLPFRVNTLDEQCDRAYDQLEAREEPMRKNTFLQSLKDQNWVLYYALLSRHLTELIPIIYTPTEVSPLSQFLVLHRQCCSVLDIYAMRCPQTREVTFLLEVTGAAM